MTAEAGARKNTLLVLLSLLGPAWAILLTPTLKLYLTNQDELRYQVSLLEPYLIAATVCWFLMGTLYLVLGRYRSGRSLVWIYYLAGFGFIALASIMSVTQSGTLQMIIAAAIAAAVVGVAVLLSRSTPPENVAGLFCVAMLALIATDISGFVLERERPSPIRAEASSVSRPSGGSSLPNIYHVVFDEYQTEMFELALDDETRHALRGFTYFPETTTPFGRTLMSLPAIFTGKMYDFESPQIEYQRQAFSGPDSVLHHLRQKGYSTEGFMHKFYAFSMPLFDRIERHQRRFGLGHAGLSQAFADLWVYSVVPKPISRLMLGSETFSQFEGQNVLNPEVPILSYQAMESMLAYEAERGPHGRYTFIHLILPHFPNVLAADCSYRIGEETNPLAQSRCANAIMRKLIHTLKGLARLDDSIIIFQGDHGSRFEVINGRLKRIVKNAYSLEWSRARSRPLLLIKPPDARAPLEISHQRSSLLDVAPTLMGLLGSSLPHSDGVDLISGAPDPGRVRLYHFYDKLGESEWTNSMTRYRIDGSTLTRIGAIELRNNPRPEG